MLRLLAVAAAVALFCDCRRDVPPGHQQPSVTSLSPESLQLEINAPARVRAGGSAPMTLRARNIGSRPLQLYLRGREIAFDIVVTDRSGTVVWRRLEGEVVPAIVQARRVGPGEQLEFRHTWDLRSNRGEPMKPGEYSIVGLLLRDEPEAYRTPAVRIEVLP